MWIYFEIDKLNILKVGSTLILRLDDKQTDEFTKVYANFRKKPMKANFLVDEEEQRTRLAQISDDQRNKIYALFKDIANFTGDNQEAVKLNLKFMYRQAYDLSDFSLSNCDKEVAKDFITFIVTWCVANSVGLQDVKPLDVIEDVEAFMYICIKQKKCCIDGKPGEIHHTKALGMGRDRKTFDDSGLEKICLCRECHTEAHTIGWESFADKYHVVGILV